MSRKRIEEILLECIEAIKAGKSDVAGCLKRYPSLREELEPLLNIAVSLDESPDVRPSRKFKVRARASLMEHIRANHIAKRPSHIGQVVKVKRMAYSIRFKAFCFGFE